MRSYELVQAGWKWLVQIWLHPSDEAARPQTVSVLCMPEPQGARALWPQDQSSVLTAAPALQLSMGCAAVGAAPAVNCQHEGQQRACRGGKACARLSLAVLQRGCAVVCSRKRLVFSQPFPKELGAVPAQAECGVQRSWSGVRTCSHAEPGLTCKLSSFPDSYSQEDLNDFPSYLGHFVLSLH